MTESRTSTNLRRQNVEERERAYMLELEIGNLPIERNMFNIIYYIL